MFIQFKLVYMYSRNALDILKCANKWAVHILGGALHNIQAGVSAFQRVGLKGFHYILYIGGPR